MKTPTLLLRNGHVMTVAASLWPRRFILPECQRRIFKVDESTCVVTECHWQSNRLTAPTVILVHGLEGDARRPYMLGSAQKAFAAGFNAVRMNVRNCGNTEHLTPTLYHSGWTQDLRAILFELIKKDQLQQIFLLGFSMGGNHVLKLGGELAADAPAQLKAICAISPAIDLALASRTIGLKQNRIYEQRFLNGLKQKVKTKNKLFPGQFVFKGMRQARSLWEFDELVTAPCFGYRDALDYYQNNSSVQVLDKIARPTLILRAKDDPFLPAQRYPAVENNPNIQDLVLEFGGHLGFMQLKPFMRAEFWAESKAVEFLKSHQND